jgi:hypothetical protein
LISQLPDALQPQIWTFLICPIHLETVLNFYPNIIFG